MNKRPLKLKPLTLPCKLEFLDALAVFVQQASKEANLDYRTSYRLRLAVDEIATNIILHGLSDSPQPSTLTVYAELDDQYLTICLEDTGSGYNPAEAIPPDKIRGPVQGEKVGGWGIY
ncbi:ATP-binding protein, partial [Thermoflexus hugenholtzii]